MEVSSHDTIEDVKEKVYCYVGKIGEQDLYNGNILLQNRQTVIMEVALTSGSALFLVPSKTTPIIIQKWNETQNVRFLKAAKTTDTIAKLISETPEYTAYVSFEELSQTIICLLASVELLLPPHLM